MLASAGSQGLIPISGLMLDLRSHLVRLLGLVRPMGCGSAIMMIPAAEGGRAAEDEGVALACPTRGASATGVCTED